ncbi:uncharacterized protein LOC110443738 [Mizuhopecten yessoensis]|uniref:uncharacterized protein LOC110443738 n=1 Tax=Mizuhopecten yessoensis TaxID=6573 RepID=UPI000B45D961|nr:uncharacterized protein LOC110443738 [Mizuhopecten yessoensis]
MWIYMVFFLGLTCAASLSNDQRFTFEKSFQEFYHGNGYLGAQVGVYVDGRLPFLRGYGHDHTLTDIRPESVMPIAGASKAFTALTVLKMVEEGQLDLGAKVFGADGILSTFEPWRADHVDRRIYDITVDNLLRHTAGWDSQRSNIYDPVLNIALLERGYKVKNIADEMDLPQPIEPDDVIRYMMSRRLDYTPGTDSVVSNLGYIILGKVITQVSGVEYSLYVKERILEPCGLMHTRIGRPRVYKREHGDMEPVFQGFGDVLPIFVDSALGWESNAADLLRLFMCMDGSGDFQLLNRTSVASLIAKPAGVPIQHHDRWIGAGFHVNLHGAIWINGEYYTDDIVFYHKGPLLRPNNGYHDIDTRGEARAWAIIMHGQTFVPIRNIIRNMMEASGTHWSTDDYFTNDIVDVSAQYQGVQRTVRFKVNEHHLTSFINAAKQLRYDIIWLNGLSYQNQTWFTVIAEKQNRSIYNDFLIEHGLTEKQLYHRKVEQEKRGYNLTFFQNYRSRSHRDKKVFVASFRRHAYNNHTKIKYGLEHFTQPYDKLLHLFVENGYYPTSQSLMYEGFDGLVSFVLEKDLDAKGQKDFKSYDDISLYRLTKIVQGNARYRRKLAYLDASDYFGKPVFSAVFIRDTKRNMVFNAELTENSMRTIIKRNEESGFLPKIIAGYTDKDKNLKYAMCLEK